jgi:hypothetical protein
MITVKLTGFGIIWSQEKEPNLVTNSLTAGNKALLRSATDPVLCEFESLSMQRIQRSSRISLFLFAVIVAVVNLSCAPRIVSVIPIEGAPATTVTVSMEYLVGWPRVEISDQILDWPQLKLIAASPERRDVPGEELVWIEDKFLQFKIPDISPGEYVVTIHDDKGPPGDPIYSALETTAYVAFPPVWPFVFRSNQAQFSLKVLPKN